MLLKELMRQQEFLEILDKEDSKDMAEYLYCNLGQCDYVHIANMFKELNIFQDIALYDADPNKKYRYIMSDAFRNIQGTIDARGAEIFYNGFFNPIDCEIIFDDTTLIRKRGVRIIPRGNTEKYILTFIGIPKFVDYRGIEIDVHRLDQIEIRAKADITDKVKELFEKYYIMSNRETLKNEIKEI